MSLVGLAVAIRLRAGGGAETIHHRIGRQRVMSLQPSGRLMSPPDTATPAGAAVGWQPLNAGFAIPRVLHQSWTTRSIPAALSKHVRSWSELQPDWGYRLHTDADNLALVKQRYAWFESTYYRLTFIQQADVARLLYMHAFGGVYADLDVELLRPLRPFLELVVARTGARAILGAEPAAHSLLLESKPRQACNAVLASERGHPFWLWLLRRIELRMRMGAEAVGGGDNPDDPVGSTGPRFLEIALREWESSLGVTSRARVYVAPPEALYPLWDAGQEATFRERCEPGQGLALAAWPNWANISEIAEQRLGGRVSQICARLRSEQFVPTTYISSFTAHHWAHTWLGGPISGDSPGDGPVLVDRAEVGGMTEDASSATARSRPLRLDEATQAALRHLDAELGDGVRVTDVEKEGPGLPGGSRRAGAGSPWRWLANRMLSIS